MVSLRLNTDILDSIIIGRVEPHIYAFTTETVPNYLKVGDTYRAVSTRIKEWSCVYPNLKHIYTHSARIDDNTIFRDFSVHDFIENSKRRHRLMPGDIPTIPYYSREFFKDATPADIDEAIDDITESAVKNDGRYSLYTSDHLPKIFTYTRGASFEPRQNQAEVIDNFEKAVNNGRKNLLMFAVMRFGKSFTALCCAKQMEAKLVLVVSAKAEVRDEWKKTVESIGNFEGYIFADKENLLQSSTFLRDSLNEDKRIVLFLTLQDLQGDGMKHSHLEVFSLPWDLLLADETHFGVRAEHYGKVLEKRHNLTKAQIAAEQERQMKDMVTLDDLDDILKELHTNITIHLSGTPYRILMGDEFDKEDIIAFVQFSDIADAQKAWIDKHKYDDSVAEWDNPYFGFPQMVRFAFTPNKTSLDKLEELKKAGATTSFSEVFRPKAMTPSNSDYKKFVHEEVVLDFLKVIDGSKNDTNVLGFLDNDRIKQGNLCRHLVIVLPYCASCDALEELLKTHKEEFRNLCDYDIVNISGLNRDKKYKDTAVIKSYIADCEAKGKKTITLTVNRMLTGNTVPEWDTMIFLRQSSSPEEYDQAIFRLQNPYIVEYKDSGHQTVKLNMKPQTILVDFDPERIFRLQERKSQIYNVNIENNGNSRLRERIEKELSISPIITLDHNKLREVTATNILDVVRNYAATKSMVDEASDMPVDLSLLDDEKIRNLITSLNPIDSKKGISIKAHQTKGNGNDVDASASGDTYSNGQSSNATSGNSNSKTKEEDSEEKQLQKKFATYYALILFFAFLTDDDVSSLDDIISVMDSSQDNIRISNNLGLSKDVLKLIKNNINGFTLSRLDYKIQNTNSICHDSSKSTSEKVTAALTKFGRMSASEIVTPIKVANGMVAMLPEDVFSHGPVLDIASKQGEFTIALLDRFGSAVADKIFSVCTSKLAYEFTRKIYKLLNISTHQIFKDITSYDLINPSNNTLLEQLKAMNISTVIGNPPYQIQNEGYGNGADPIYHHFIDTAQTLSSRVFMIHPARFLFRAGKTPKAWNEKILHDQHFKIINFWIKSTSVFPNVDVMGGIAVSLWDKNKNFGAIKTFTAHAELNSILKKVKKLRHDSFATLVGPREAYGLTKFLYEEHPELANRQSQGHKYSLGANVFEVLPEIFSDSEKDDCIKIFGRYNNKRGTKWVKSSYIDKYNSFPYYKVIVPEANGTGAIGEVPVTPIIGIPIIGAPGIGHTDTYLSIGEFKSAEEASACLKYVKSKFARCMLGTLKATQHNPKDTWANVPLQDFSDMSDIDWSKSVDEIDAQLYAKYSLSEEEIAFIESMIKPM